MTPSSKDRPKKRLGNIQISGALKGKAQARETIAVASTFTAEPLKEPLAFWLKQLSLPAKVEFAPFNQVFQQLLDPAGLLVSNAAGANVVLVRVEDWRPPDEAGRKTSSENGTESHVRELIAALQGAAQRSSVPYIVCVCPPSKGASEAHPAEFFERMETVLETELRAVAGVHVMRSQRLLATYPVQAYEDRYAFEIGAIPYTPELFTALATMVTRAIYGLRAAAAKVIVLDCDNTLWRGVCGEDGALGVGVEGPYAALQEFMIAQKNAGLVLCLCSKNNDADVVQVFKRNGAMRLGMGDIVARRVNWQAKSQNLTELAAELNLGLDSFVFVDDSPLECAEVRAHCPAVTVLELPADAQRIPAFLRHAWVFDHWSVTGEDAKRTGLYAENAQRETLRKQVGTLEEFYQSLELQVTLRAMEAGDRARVAQLTERTNQFHCHKARRSEAQIAQALQGGAECLVVEVRDRFGDYGLVGAMMYTAAAGALRIDTCLLSCRALGRKVEHHMMARAGALAKERGFAWVEVLFTPTEKNQPAAQFLDSAGAQAKTDGSPAVYRFACETLVALPEAKLAEAAPAAVEPRQSSVQTRDGVLAQRIASELGTVEAITAAMEAGRPSPRAPQSTAYVAPATPLEIQIAVIWSEVLHIPKIGVHDNFFELGGQSLLAVQVFARIEERLGAKLPLNILFNTPTVAGIVAAMPSGASADTTPQNSLRVCRAGGSKPPLYAAHGIGGTVLTFRQVAKYLEEDQPVYCLEGLDLDGSWSTLAELATCYVRDIRSFQPEGPYHLVGSSFGGMVVFEIAQQLYAQGQEVAFAGLLDTFNLGNHNLQPRTEVVRNRVTFLAYRTRMHLHRLFSRKASEWPRYAAGRLLAVGRRVQGVLWRVLYRSYRKPASLPASMRNPKRVYETAGLDYVPKLYPGKVTLFRTDRAGTFIDPNRGWAGLASGGLEIIDVPGDHNSMLQEPHASVLAREMTRCLARRGKKGLDVEKTAGSSI